MIFKQTTSAIVAILLSACGGSGGSEAAPAGNGPATDPPIGVNTPAPAPVANGSIWKPKVSDTWQWQLRGSLNAGYRVSVYDIDLFNTPQSTIDALHARGVKVVCYFSAGSSEDFREDYSRFASADKGAVLKGFDGERWLDVRSENVRSVMRDRIALASAKKCDAVEPDNVDGFANDTGFPLTFKDQLEFNQFLAKEAHGRGLAVGLKNDLDQIPQLVDLFDFAVNEQCHEFDECDKVLPFIAAGKPVFNAEYDDKYVRNEGGARDALCKSARASNIRTLVLPLELEDSFRFGCD